MAITMKRIIVLSTMIIAIVAMSAGAGTFAYFSDTATSTGNTFTSAILKIELPGGHSLPFIAINIVPGYVEEQVQPVKNVGTIQAAVYIRAENFKEPSTWAEELPEPESGIEVGPKDFADILYIRVSYSTNGIDYTEIYDDSLRDLNTIGNAVTIDPGEIIYFKFEAYLPADLDDADNIYEDTPGGIPSVDGNEDDNAYQADGVECDIVFYATQPIAIP
ncbi:hypothetical protein DRO69_13120 [Candidatus Bathyarchaeota archaeon]|nr:MAG: hypothetical protein DRO69_13120 [Candidatus Bathyarchaeota archaeon]